jgi:hypothetical protein
MAAILRNVEGAMGRKFATYLLCAGAVTTPSGMAAAQQPNFFDGAYVGAGVGWDRNASNGRYTLNENGVDVFSFKFDRAGNGVQGQFFGGYGRTFGSFYASGEIGGGLSSATANIHNGFVAAGDSYDLAIKIRQRWSLAPSVRAGYLLQPDLLAFVRFGWSFARTRISYTSAEISPLGNQLFSGSTSKWLNGPRPICGCARTGRTLGTTAFRSSAPWRRRRMSTSTVAARARGRASCCSA